MKNTNKQLAEKLINEGEASDKVAVLPNFGKLKHEQMLTSKDVKKFTKKDWDYLIENQVLFGAKADDVDSFNVVYPSEFTWDGSDGVGSGYVLDEVKKGTDLVTLMSVFGFGKGENEVYCKKVYVDLGWFVPPTKED